MLPFPNIDPVFLRLGPLQFRWYGLMYLLGLAIAYFLIKARAAARNVVLAKEHLYDLIVYAAIGVFLGGRLGYTLFYNFSYYLDHPLKILAVWEGGMSFHGGLLGTIVALWLFCRRRGLAVYSIADLVGRQMFRGAWSSQAVDRSAATLRSFTRRDSKAGCCLPSCGSSAAI